MAEFILNAATVAVTLEPKAHEAQQLIVTRGTDAEGAPYGFSARFGLQREDKQAWDEASFQVFNLPPDAARDARILLFCAVLPDPASLPEPYATVYGGALARLQTQLEAAGSTATLAGTTVQEAGVALVGMLGQGAGE